MPEPTTDPLAVEIAAFDARRAELERDHLGKFVVFHGGQLVGSFDNLDNAAHEAVTRFGRGPYLIRRVGDPTSMAIPTSVAFRMSSAAH
jgi:hypothetical protein